MPMTFADLGIPFALFEAPTQEATEYVGIGVCSLCGQPEVHCFDLDIGADVVVTCPHCGVDTALDAAERKPAPCHTCTRMVPFPPIPDERLTACYACLRDGRAALTKDTVLGMVSWEEAAAGVTHGLPHLSVADFELVPRPNGWTGACVPPALLLELVRTPTYLTWQGEHWEFCCARPMIYLGLWTQKEFQAYAPSGNGRALFDQIVQDAHEEMAEAFWAPGSEWPSVYAFRCGSCGNFRAHWDCD